MTTLDPERSKSWPQYG